VEKTSEQKVSWKVIKRYDTFEEANAHRNKLSGLVKVHKMNRGEEFAVKVGTPIKD